jgi:G3E family GTPase
VHILGRIDIFGQGVEPTLLLRRCSSDFPRKFYLDGVITVVDTKHLKSQVRREPSGEYNFRNLEASRQIAAGDIVLLNKVDQCSTADVDFAKQVVQCLNPTALTRCTSYCDVESLEILGQRFYDDGARQITRTPPSAAGLTAAHSGITAITLPQHESDRALPTIKVRQWLEEVIAAHWKDLYRLKGIVRVRPENPTQASGTADEVAYVVHGIHGEMHDYLDQHFFSKRQAEAVQRRQHQGRLGAPSSGAAPELECGIVLIGKGLPKEALTASYRALFDS